MRLCREYDTGAVICHLVQVVDNFYFTRVLKGKVIEKLNLGQDEGEAIKDFESQIQLVELENGV